MKDIPAVNTTPLSTVHDDLREEHRRKSIAFAMLLTLIVAVKVGLFGSHSIPEDSWPIVIALLLVLAFDIMAIKRCMSIVRCFLPPDSHVIR